MKNLLILLCVIFFIGTNQTIFSQEYASVLNNDVSYKKRSPIYDYSEIQLNNTDTIPDFESKPDKLKITGTIYQSDGKTPARDIILYVYQTDEEGNFELKRDDLHKRYVYHRGWVKTNADGQYTIYTFMPGKYIRSKELKQIHRVIKEPGKPEYELNSFFFNDDPLIPDLTLACRAQAVKSMLRLEKEGNMFIASKDIILEKSNSTIE
jgi:protocatechuate 3,4-dioxygenase, beta subunit